MNKNYEIPENEPQVVSESPMVYNVGVNPIDELWAIIQNQSLDVQRALMNRLTKFFSSSANPYTLDELSERIHESELEMESGSIVSGEHLHDEMRTYLNSLTA